MPVRSLPTVTVPRQTGPVEPPSAPRPSVPAAPLLERDRPWTADERQFLVGLVGLFVLLETSIVGGLAVATQVWT